MSNTITPNIVNLNVNQIYASAPIQLQRRGAIVSTGSTNITAGSYQYIGAASVLASYLATGPDTTYLTNFNASFFAQGPDVGYYVLELGALPSGTTVGTALAAWLTANPGVFYALTLSPADIAGDTSDLENLVSQYTSPNSRLYFVIPTSAANLNSWAKYKSVLCISPSPTASATEADAAGLLYNVVVNNPSPTQPAAPLAFRWLYGLTAWPQDQWGTTVTQILTASGNAVLTGAEGGISTAALFRGTVMSGDQFMSWYGVDWVALNIKQALAAAIFNGSNSNNPLIYNQAGINSLLSVAKNVITTAVKYKLIQSGVVTATNWQDYVTANPSDFAAGIYNGFTCTVVDISGFLNIGFTIDSTQFAV